MKILKSLPLILLGMSFTAKATPVAIQDFNWSITDLADIGLKKEKLYSQMDRDLIKPSFSICANRALMWVYDFKRKANVDAAKIFLFYTSKTGAVGEVNWWYHVAPVIAENSELFVMDAGFSAIKKPLSINEWLGRFSHGANCKEIQASETELVELIDNGRQFPRTTKYGTYDCYYKLVPAGLWYPSTVAKSITGGNVPNEIQSDEVYSACVEAITGPIGGLLGAGKKRCKKYLGL